MGAVETCEPQTQGLSVNSIGDSLSLNFLIYFAKMSSYFSIKTKKRKVRKCLKCVKEFLHRFDFANGKYLSIFLGVFARIVRVTHFAQAINYCERAHGKIYPCKADKNNREFTFFCFVLFFQHNSKTKFIIPSSTQQQKQKVYCA